MYRMSSLGKCLGKIVKTSSARGLSVFRSNYPLASGRAIKLGYSPIIRSGSRAADHLNEVAVVTNDAIGTSPLKDRENVIFSVQHDRKDQALRITWLDGHRSIFHLIWLRDEDRSVGSVDALTAQRLVDSGRLPLHIGASQINISNGGCSLEVEWDIVVAGIKRSVFDSSFLRSHCSTTQRNQNGCLPQYAFTWGKELGTVLPTLSVPYESIMLPGVAGEQATLRLLAMVRTYGVGIISGTPECKELSQRAVEKLAPVRQTFYGGFWETKVLPTNDVDNIDSAYSTVPLPAHTDGNYFEDPPGLQIFHCLKADPTGGDTLLVDGFRVAETLRLEHPEAFALLASMPVTFRHSDPRHRLEAHHTVIGLDRDGKVDRFHFNNLDRAPLRGLPPAAVPAFYRAWSALCAEIESPNGQVWVKLRPGNLIVINNRRVMHGRSQVTGESGRVLVGCYVTYEDFISHLSVLSSRHGAAVGLSPTSMGRLPPGC